jgi:hypothetical protein
MMLREDGHAEQAVRLMTHHRIKSLAGAMRLKHWALIYFQCARLLKNNDGFPYQAGHGRRDKWYFVGGLRSQGKDVRCPVLKKNAKIVCISLMSRRRV